MSFSNEYGTVVIYNKYGVTRVQSNTLPVELMEEEKISYRSPMIVVTASVNLITEGELAHVHRGEKDECHAVIKRTLPNGSNYCFEVTGTNLEMVREVIDIIYHALGVKNLNWNDLVLKPEPCFSGLPKNLPNAWKRFEYLIKCLKRLLIDYILYNK